MVTHIKISRQRIEKLLSEKEIIPEIEAATKTQISINKETDEVEIVESESGNAYEAVRAADVVKAIGRGFSKKTAFRLLEEDAILVVVDLSDFYGKKKHSMERIKSRVIGTHGKAKQRIAVMTDTDIVVYGKTVSIIGKAENALLAQRAVETLCEGAMHTTIFRMLEREAAKL